MPGKMIKLRGDLKLETESGSDSEEEVDSCR